jgi:hypothetical protein
MKRNISTQLKAAFLLIVFSINTIISVACSLGLDVCFCDNDDHEETELMAHEGCSHHHDEAVKDHKSKGGCEDNCCDENAVRFSQADKSLPQCLASLNVVSFTALISTFYYIDVLHTFKSSASIRYFVRSHYSPIPDFRIAIQSFQI